MAHQRDYDSSIRLYAELLPNIRQITFFVSLPSSPPDLDSLDIQLSPDCHSIEVSSHHESVTLTLPAFVPKTSVERLKVSKEQKRGGEFSFRLLVDEKSSLETRNGDEVGQESGEDNGTPWGATRLGPRTRLRCRGCQNVLLSSHSIMKDDSHFGKNSPKIQMPGGLEFKNLPSQNWAEMMDFWHCHKPDVPGHNHDHGHKHSHAGKGLSSGDTQDPNETVKGYGASNRVMATSGTVFVDVSSFVISEHDGVGLKKEPWTAHRRDEAGDENDSAPPSDQGTSSSPVNDNAGRRESQTIRLLCRRCGVMLGTEDNEVAIGGWRIYKADVSVSPGSKETAIENFEEEIWEEYPVDMIVAAQLLELIEREGVRRFVVHCNDSDGDDGVLLWVFNPDILYSSSSSRTGVEDNGTATSRRAMKVFYQHLSASKVESLLTNELGERQRTSVGELDLHSSSILEKLKYSLNRSTQMLPVLTRKFQEWNVGIMDRI